MRIGSEGIIGWVAQHGEPLLANDVAAEPRYIPDDPRLLPDTRAELAVPLIVEGEVVGVLDVQSTQTRRFWPGRSVHPAARSPTRRRSQSTPARAYEAQRVEAWMTTVMLQVAEATSQAESVTEVLDTAVRVTAMLAGVESTISGCGIDEYQAFQYGASFGLSGDRRRIRASLRFPEGDWPALDRLRLTRRPDVLDMLNGNHSLPAEFGNHCTSDLVALLPMLNKGDGFRGAGRRLRRKTRAPGR